jgi:hypothetical protein
VAKWGQVPSLCLSLLEMELPDTNHCGVRSMAQPESASEAVNIDVMESTRPRLTHVVPPVSLSWQVPCRLAVVICAWP